MKTRSSVCALLAGLLLALPVRGDFVVRNVEAQLQDQNLRVTTRIELNLSEQAELAIENGVPLVMLTEFELQRQGLLWKKTLLSSRIRRQLRYHSLADGYVVEDLEEGEIDMFNSVGEALNSMGVLREQLFAVPGDLRENDRGYTLSVRSRLDINRLPAALRPLAFFSPSWRLSSDWTKWQVKTQ